MCCVLLSEPVRHEASPDRQFRRKGKAEGNVMDIHHEEL